MSSTLASTPPLLQTSGLSAGGSPPQPPWPATARSGRPAPCACAEWAARTKQGPRPPAPSHVDASASCQAGHAQHKTDGPIQTDRRPAMAPHPATLRPHSDPAPKSAQRPDRLPAHAGMPPTPVLSLFLSPSPSYALSSYREMLSPAPRVPPAPSCHLSDRSTDHPRTHRHRARAIRPPARPLY